MEVGQIRLPVLLGERLVLPARRNASVRIFSSGKKWRRPGGLLPAVFVLCLLGAVSQGCRSRDSKPPARTWTPTRGYIVISIDTLRADHLGAYGYPRETSPVFDRLAAQGTLFEQAVVQYPATLTSHISIFTGVYPQEHQVLPPSTVLAESIETLPERFQAHGFRTAGHTEGGFVAGGYGFRRGFDEFTDTSYRSDTDVERTFERGLDFLRRLDPEDRFFLFLHTYSVHDPYEPPERYRSMFWSGENPSLFESTGENLRRVNQGELEISAETVEYFEAMYDASIRYVDDVLGDFIGALQSLELLRETTLVITSDHGEEFLEHGKMAHTQVYPESLLVPLLMWHPQQPTPHRVAEVVELVDLAPTLYELAGFAPSGQVSGRSLLAQLERTSRPSPASQGYSEVFDVDFVRTVVAQDRDQRFQLLMVEPEWDPVGPWIRDSVTFDTEKENLTFEAQSFHVPRQVRIEIDGESGGVLEMTPGWSSVEIEMPGGRKVYRVTLTADGCLSPAEVGESEDDRCLAFQLRGFMPRRFELYDLAKDPNAEVDLFRSHAGIRRRLSDRLLGLEWTPLARASERALSREDEETLKALGYLD